MIKKFFSALSSYKTYLVPVVLILMFSTCSKKITDKNQTTAAEISAETSLADNLGTAGLVAWYTFNGNTLDSSGNSNNVAFNNAKAVADRFGNPKGAYSFNGVDNYMRVPNSASLNPSSEITIFAIIKIKGFYGGACHGNKIVAKGNSDKKNGVYSLNFDDQRFYNYNGCNQPLKPNKQDFYARYGNENGSGSATGADDPDFLQKNQWYAITYTYNGTASKLYVNGVLKDTQKKTTTFTANTDDLFIGRLNDPNYPYWFNGVIDEIRIYNKALNANQVQMLPQ